MTSTSSFSLQKGHIANISVRALLLKLKYVVKHKSAKLFLTYAVGKLEAERFSFSALALLIFL